MRKLFYIFAIVAMTLTSCNNNNQEFTIEGEVSDTSCDGAQIFLVPLTEAATHETVDSVVVKDRHFTFKGNKTRICALRMQMPQRANFQELLVYTEPGNIKAFVAQRGSVTGTKNNDLLQAWKTKQETCMQKRMEAFVACGKNMEDPVFKQTLDSLKTVMADATYQLLKTSGLNPLTRFLYKGNKRNLNDEQMKDLQFMEDDYQHQLDSIRKAYQAK